MHKHMDSAVGIASSYRYAGDTALPRSEHKTLAKSVRERFFQSGIKISSELTPSLAVQLDSVLDRLNIPRESTEAFVYASPEVQAECYAGDTKECVIRFSSALIDLLSDQEFSFVVGHELGHFLYGHGMSCAPSETENIEHLIKLRAQEISADRVGLRACGNIETALHALMKTASGLTCKHLRFDVSSYIAQLKNSSSYGMQSSTHPSITIRCKALLWFSLMDHTEIPDNKYIDGIVKIDKRIQSDLDKFIDGPARAQIEEAISNYQMWSCVNEILRQECLTKHKQAVFADEFGEEILQKIILILKNTGKSELHTLVSEKLEEARLWLYKLAPNEIEARSEELRNKLSFFSGNRV